MPESRVLLLRVVFSVGRPIRQYGELAALSWAHYVRTQNHTIAHGHSGIFLQNKLRFRVRGVLTKHENGS